MNNNNIKKTWVKVCFKADLYKSECAFFTIVPMLYKTILKIKL